MNDETEVRKYTLPEYAVDVLVKSELHRTATYEEESRKRLEYTKEDMELRCRTAKTYDFMLTAVIYQSILFTIAVVWWVLK